MIDLEQRVGGDRRARRTPATGAYWLRGNRRSIRREAEIGPGYYVDHPGAKTLAAVGLLAMLVILDGALTLQLTDRGAIEANPVMAFFLSLGESAFLGVKYGLALTALGVLLIHKNFVFGHPRLRVKWIIVALLGGYGGLVAYQMTAIGDFGLQEAAPQPGGFHSISSPASGSVISCSVSPGWSLSSSS